MDTFFCPIGVWIRVPLYNAQDTSLIWTLSSVPLVSGLEFHCSIYLASVKYNIHHNWLGIQRNMLIMYCLCACCIRGFSTQSTFPVTPHNDSLFIERKQTSHAEVHEYPNQCPLFRAFINYSLIVAQMSWERVDSPKTSFLGASSNPYFHFYNYVCVQLQVYCSSLPLRTQVLFIGIVSFIQTVLFNTQTQCVSMQPP